MEWDDGISFKDYEGGKTLPGNSDDSTVVKNTLDPAILPGISDLQRNNVNINVIKIHKNPQ